MYSLREYNSLHQTLLFQSSLHTCLLVMIYAYQLRFWIGCKGRHLKTRTGHRGTKTLCMRTLFLNLYCLSATGGLPTYVKVKKCILLFCTSKFSPYLCSTKNISINKLIISIKKNEKDTIIHSRKHPANGRLFEPSVKETTMTDGSRLFGEIHIILLISVF